MGSPNPTFKEECILIEAGFSRIAGVDEVGAGCLAGPVFAAAVILPTNSRIALIRDSKLLSGAQRDRVVRDIERKSVAWAIGMASPAEIDDVNVRQACALAMRRAVEALGEPPQYVLVDGYGVPGFPCPHKSIVKGDRLVKSIAAASIIAKVARDAFMADMDALYPGYGFAEHKGYATETHRTALTRLGPCALHRRSYEPVRALMDALPL